MIVLSFDTPELRDGCTKLQAAQAWIGPMEAQALTQMIADIEAFQNADEVIAFLGATVDAQGCIMIDFSRKHRAILRSTLPDTPLDPGGIPIWQQVRRLMLTEIVEL